MMKINVIHKLIGLVFCILIIIDIIDAQKTPRIVTSPGPNVEGIPDTTDFPNNDYEKLLAYSLYFFEAQRSGALPANNRVPWRHDSGLKDGFVEGVDLTGGYYDAGDYMKFTLPLSWTLTMISWGGIEWFEGYELSGQDRYLYDMVKWGTDWLSKAHSIQTNELYVQVGVEAIDHSYWGSDLNIPLPRTAYKIGGAVLGTDIAAETAATFASSSILFKTKFADSEYASKLLLHAKSLYAFAERTPYSFYDANLPQAKALYGSTNFQDKLVWGALWLYRATGDVIYLNKAKTYFTTFELSGWNQAINWADKTCATYILFAQLTKGALDEATWKAEAERYLDVMINPALQVPKSLCSYTPGGLLWCDGDSDADSLDIPLNIGFVALVYAPYATTTEKSTRYKAFATGQISYALGENPMKMPYVVGISPNSPKNPHHAGAHGSTTNNMLVPVETVNILYGAVVGGPKKDDTYVDNRTLFNSTEVTLDYNAPWQGLMAYQVMNLKVEGQTKPVRPAYGKNSTTEEIPTTEIPSIGKPTPEKPKSKSPSSSENSENSEDSAFAARKHRNVAIIVGSVLGSIFLIMGALIACKHSLILNWLRNKRNELSKITKDGSIISRPNSAIFDSVISRPNSAIFDSIISRPNSAYFDSVFSRPNGTVLDNPKYHV